MANADGAPVPFLRFENVAKRYPGVAALRGVSFDVAEGSVHALIGENGAGKSTLLKILGGSQRPTSGCLRIGGLERDFRSTSEAIAAGVAVIQQELQLVPGMTVGENIYLGHLPVRRGVVDRRRLRELAAAQMRRLGEEIDPDTRLARLPIGQRQTVEIAKALSRGAKVVAFDEPTSSLSAREIDRLFAVIGELRRSGCAILYVSHRMEEIFRICDACTVLRDGGHVRTHSSLAGLSQNSFVRDMVGRSIDDVFGYAPRPLGPPALEVDGLSGPRLPSPVSLEVRQGEILGLFGLVGAGRTRLLKLLFGALRPSGGSIRIHGRPVAVREPIDAIRAGLVYCTEDRKREGIVPMLSVTENCNLTARRNNLRAFGVVNERWERSNVLGQIGALGIKTPSPEQLIRNLSGGTQQKVILARWLSEEVKVMLLDEPTRGIDIGAKSEIYSLIFRLAREGMALIVVSSDLPEVLGLADCVAVMREGRLSAVLDRADASPERVLAHALPLEKAVPA